MKIRQIIRTGIMASALIGGGYLLGSGTIGDVLNIGESKIGAASTRSDNEELSAETERLKLEAENAAAERFRSLGREYDQGSASEGEGSVDNRQSE